MAAFIASYEEAISLGPAVVGGRGLEPGAPSSLWVSGPYRGILMAQAYRQFLQESTLRAYLLDCICVLCTK